MRIEYQEMFSKMCVCFIVVYSIGVKIMKKLFIRLLERLTKRPKEENIELSPQKIKPTIQVDDGAIILESLNDIKSEKDLHIFIFESMMNTWLDHRGGPGEDEEEKWN